MKSISLHIAAAVALMLTLSAVKVRGEVPRLPETVVTPDPLTLKCVTDARTLPALELCRAAAESARAITEEYNVRILRFCDSLLRVDGKLRHKAQQGRLKWQDYEELKEDIQVELGECDLDNGDYYAPYRARMREYRQVIEHIPKRRESIVRGVWL